MTNFLYTLCNQAILGGVAIVAVCLLRLLLTRLPKKAPRYLVCLLWLVVAVRLLCPFSVQTPLGLLPTDRPISDEVLQAEPLPADRPTDMVGDTTANTDTVLPVTPPADTPTDTVGGDIQTNINTTPPADGTKAQGNALHWLFALWAAGMVGLLLHGTVGHHRLRRRVAEAVPEETRWGRVYRSESIRTPFVLGLVRPRVYVPAALPEADLPYVVAHEQAHIRRGDPWYKVFAYLLLAVFWFQPLCWLAFRLLCRDLEVACDERVVKTFGEGAEEQKKAYSAALLGCAAREQGLAFCPVAFGGTDIGGRIKNILHYKKPVLWLTVTAAAVCAAVGVALLTTRPARQTDTPLSSEGLPVQGQVITTTTTQEQTTTASTDTTETTTTTTTKKATSTTPTTAAPTTTTTTTKKPTMTTPATTDTILPFIPLDNAKKEEVLEAALRALRLHTNPERPEIGALTTDDLQFIYYNTYQETVAFDTYIKGMVYSAEVRTVTVAGYTFR
ncbi:MAG: M56 family metallopeptidase, partial [Clostridia bacterium]|nr:M56 family metallopeptidase [Clostridia bacterium]